MGKRVPQLNEAAAALQSDTAAKAEAAKSTEKGLRSKSAKRASSSGDLIPPITGSDPEDAAVTAKQGASLFDKIKSRIKGSSAHASASDASREDAAAAEFLRKGEEGSPLDRHVEQAPRKGELANAVRLESGQDKLLVNQRKLTDKVRKLLNSIEAQETYLKNIALKVVSRKHQGVVIDLPKRDDDSLGSGQTGTVASILGRKPKKD